MHSNITSAKSVPNLSSSQPDTSNDGHINTVGAEKGEKQKHHKFGFHLPNLFKKSKIAKLSSTDKGGDSVSPQSIPKCNSTSALERPKSAYVMSMSSQHQQDVDIRDTKPPTNARSSPQIPINELQAKLDARAGAGTPVDSDIVPIRDKAESISQERANDTGTEEAVVPFHQKGKFTRAICRKY